MNTIHKQLSFVYSRYSYRVPEKTRVPEQTQTLCLLRHPFSTPAPVFYSGTRFLLRHPFSTPATGADDEVPQNESFYTVPSNINLFYNRRKMKISVKISNAFVKVSDLWTSIKKWPNFSVIVFKIFVYFLYHLQTDFICETRESGDINMCRNKTSNCYPN